MATYDIRPLQLHILQILLAIDRVCKEQQLRYYIMAGTLLGAIRHKGFIPWDDDLDIGMPRADYDKLIAHASEWLPVPYELVCAENNSKYPFPFAKIQDARTTLLMRKHSRLGGDYLYIFPLDGVPTGKLSQHCHFAYYKLYKQLLYLIHRDPYKHGKGINSWVPLICRKLFTSSQIQMKIRKLMTKHDFDNSRFVCDYDDGLKGIMPKEVVGRPTQFMFEGKEVWGIEKYDKYLTQKYGDYMTIPRLGEQRQHEFHYLDLKHPYSEFI